MPLENEFHSLFLFKWVFLKATNRSDSGQRNFLFSRDFINSKVGGVALSRIFFFLLENKRRGKKKRYILVDWMFGVKYKCMAVTTNDCHNHCYGLFKWYNNNPSSRHTTSAPTKNHPHIRLYIHTLKRIAFFFILKPLIKVPLLRVNCKFFRR